MSYTTLMKQINQNNIAPVYLLYGKESYFIEKVKENIVKQLTTYIGEELTTYDLEQVPIQEVIADAETIPFFSEQKLIIAENPPFLLARQTRLPFEHDVNSLETYLDHPPSYTTLIFIARHEKLDNRRKITKTFNKKSSVLSSEPVRDRDIGKWIVQIGHEYNITFTHDARMVMESELSTNLMILHNEIEKIAHFIGEDGEVTKDIVSELISQSREMSALQLVDAVMERNLYQAIKIYKTLEKNNEEPIAMIALLAYQFRIMLQVKLLANKGIPEQQMVRALKAHPFVVKIALKRSRRFAISRLEEVLSLFTEADAAIKRGKMDKGIAFELLLYELIY